MQHSGCLFKNEMPNKKIFWYILDCTACRSTLSQQKIVCMSKFLILKLKNKWNLNNTHMRNGDCYISISVFSQIIGRG